jgi:hypothetical protein
MLRTNLDAWRATLLVSLGLSASGCGMAADGSSAEAGESADADESAAADDAASGAPAAATEERTGSSSPVLPEKLRCANEVPAAGDPTLMVCSNGIVHRPAPPEEDCMDCPGRGPVLSASAPLDSCSNDDDCAEGFLCIASSEIATSDCSDSNATSSAVVRSFACQTPDDECGADSQCENGRLCLVGRRRRICDPVPILPGCPVPGRPFLVGGEERLASVRSASDWCGPVLCVPDDLTPAVRASLCQYWKMAALREHASVAAFARFTLQLLQLGAPHDLCLGSQSAMRDEIEHARRCFALASRYAGEPLGPGPLAIEGAIEAESLAQSALLTFREGCIGETSAALEAAEALAVAADPEVQATLMLIARDERRHAKLAWRFLAWALEQDGAGEVRAALVAELERLRAQVGPTPPAGDADATIEDPSAASIGRVGKGADVGAAACSSAPSPLAQHGHSSPERCRLLSELAIREVVLPCTERLLATGARQAAVPSANVAWSA